MHTFRPGLIAAVLVAFALVVVGVRSSRTSAPEPRPPTSLAPTPQAAAVAPQPLPPVADVAPDAAAIPPRPAPDHIQRVLPHVTTEVDDWRTYTPERITVQLAPDLPATYRVVTVERDAHRTVLSAVLEQEPESGAFLVTAANSPDRWTATAVFAGVEYQITVDRAESKVVEAPESDFLCENPDVLIADDLKPDSVSVSAPVSAADGSTVVDVLFLYNPQALADRDNDAAMIDLDCARYIASGNMVLANSQVSAFRWRYLGSAPTPSYSFGENLGDNDLIPMRTSGILGDFVRQQQSSRQADQVVLLAGGVKRGGVGVAWITGPLHHSAVSYPYPTSSSGVRATSVLSYYTVVHELAHNFGCRHDRDDPVRPGVNGDGRYQYGHTITRDVGGTPRPYATVMAVNGVRIPYFSNPDVMVFDMPIGVPVDQPRAAHNARFIAEQAAAVAASSTADSPPVITVQPADATVTVGGNLTLSVEASGNALVYRWARGETVIEDAFSSTLVLSGVTKAEAGVYRANVSNARGSATSRAATVTVTDAPPPPPTSSPPSAGGSGGGGGGGAAGPMIVCALAMVVAVRTGMRLR